MCICLHGRLDWTYAFLYFDMNEWERKEMSGGCQEKEYGWLPGCA